MTTVRAHHRQRRALATGDAVSLSLRNAAGDVVPVASSSTASYARA